MLLSHCEQILRVHSADSGVHSHAHSHESGHSARGVSGGGLHCVSLCADESSRGHGRVAHDSRALSLLDEFLILFGKSYCRQRDAHDLDAAERTPLLGERLIHRVFEVGVVRHDLIRTELEIRELSERRLEGGDELALQRRVELAAFIIAFDVSAYVLVEEHRVGDLIGIDAGASDRDIDIESDLGVHYAERNGICRAELVVEYFLHVEVIDSLILTGVAAVCKAFADHLEGFLYALAEIAGEDRWLCRVVPGELARLRAELDDLALLDDYHALSVSDSDTRAVRDDIVITLRVGGASGDPLLTFGYKDLFRN